MSDPASDRIQISINGQQVSAEAGSTILQAAQNAGIQIPTICFHEACSAFGLCRICVVEVEGTRLLVPACTARVNQDMVVYTQSGRVKRSRKTILELLASAVDLSEAPEILDMISEYEADPDRFEGGKTRQRDVLDDNPMYIRDYEKCILCWRCVQVCAEDAQYTFALSFNGRGFDTGIGTFFDKGMLETTCVFCGQCLGVCPTGALKSRRQWLLELGKTPEEIIELAPAGGRRRRHRD